MTVREFWLAHPSGTRRPGLSKRRSLVYISRIAFWESGCANIDESYRDSAAARFRHAAWL